MTNLFRMARKGLRFVSLGPHHTSYIRELKSCQYFDRTFYVRNYPDLRPIYKRFPERHYATIGEADNLRPNPDFSPSHYLHYNPDVRASGMPPFQHYLRIGHREGRITKELPEILASERRDLPALVPGGTPGRPQAIVAHVYYHDLWDEIAATIRGAGIEADVFVTITDRGEETDALVARIAEDFPEARAYRFPNRGRDILPFVHLVNAGLIDGYRAVAKIHTKRSPHRQDGDHWRRHLMGGILPAGRTAALLERFLADEAAGIWVADGQHYRSPDWWGSNRAGVARLLERVEIRVTGEDLAFPAGSMYWLKPVIVAMVRGMMLRPEEFEHETAQVDGTLAHAFERGLGFVVAAGGLSTVETGELKGRPPAAPPRPGFVSAFYLPQFHPTPENDAWWGRGFTEWTAVTRARPNFQGHVQPALPADLGFYDLRVTETMGAQWRLAEAAGIDAFAVYHYWFDGRRVLEAPLDALLARPDVPFSYYLTWANEAWRRNWDGLTGEILIDQTYADGFERGLAASVLPHFADQRYARPDGRRPRFVIYRPTDLPDPAGSVARLRAAWAEAGFPEVELGAVLFHVEGDSAVDPGLFDFWVEMPPHGLVGPKDFLVGGPEAPAAGLAPDPEFRGLIYDYDVVIRNSLARRFAPGYEGRVIAGVMPSWDNTARRRHAAHIAHGANPVRFAKWLRGLAGARLAGSYRRELFVNAWNEWAEKATLEPSQQYGRAYLDALAAALGEPLPVAARARALFSEIGRPGGLPRWPRSGDSEEVQWCAWHAAHGQNLALRRRPRGGRRLRQRPTGRRSTTGAAGGAWPRSLPGRARPEQLDLCDAWPQSIQSRPRRSATTTGAFLSRKSSPPTRFQRRRTISFMPIRSSPICARTCLHKQPQVVWPSGLKEDGRVYFHGPA
jgi:hypothetical protein